MINPCGWCACGPYQGARTISGVCTIIDLISVVNSAYTFALVHARENALALSAEMAGPSRAGRYHPASSEHPEMSSIGSTIVGVGLLWHVMRFLFDLLLGYGVEKRKICVIYPWILSTILSLIGLFVMDAVYFSQLVNWNGFDVEGVTGTKMPEHVRSRALTYFLVLLITLLVYTYFLWVVLAFVSTLYGDVPVPHLAPGSLPERQSRGILTNMRNGRVLSMEPLEPYVCEECRHLPPPYALAVVEEQQLPGYEEALKMLATQGNDSSIANGNVTIIKKTNDSSNGDN